MYNKHCKCKAAGTKNQYVFNLIEVIKTVKEKPTLFKRKNAHLFSLLTMPSIYKKKGLRNVYPILTSHRKIRVSQSPEAVLI